LARLKCPQCGKRLKETDRFCKSCGAAVGSGLSFEPVMPEPVMPAPVTPAPIGPAPEEAGLRTCPGCGQPVSPRLQWCPHCGARVGPEESPPRHVHQRGRRGDWGFEWRTQAEVLGWPLIHVAFGRRGGKLRVAKGVIAVGQFAIGVITFAQFGVGLLFGFGQFLLGATAIAQFAVTLFFGLGQLATGWVAIGQFALGYYALGQVAVGWHTWMQGHADPEARRFFHELARWIGLI